MKHTVLVAIGGNALVLDGESGSLARQIERSVEFGELVADLVGDGWRVLVTHGNGPQVGYILRRGELVASEAVSEGLPELPLWLAVADSQGGIGHMLTLAIDQALDRRGIDRCAVALLTHCEVDSDDPAFTQPTKPIGSAMTAEVARRRVVDEGWSVHETHPGSFRRVVPSPRPHRIVEATEIQALLHRGAVVVAAGGGGIPISRTPGDWQSLDAVIDKDRASVLLASSVGVGTVILVTGVDEVYTGYGTPGQRALRSTSPDELRALLAAGEFPAGSMGPKVESALDFVEGGGLHAIITSLPRLREALRGTAGTHLFPPDHQEPAPVTPTESKRSST